MSSHLKRKTALTALSFLLALTILAGFYLGFDSRGALADRNLVIGEPVAEGIIAVHDFAVPYTQEERNEMAREAAQSIPVFLRRDASVSESVSTQVRDIIFAATGSENTADYFRDRVSDFYETGLVDLGQLRLSYQGSRAVVEGMPEENVSGLFTVSEAREALGLDLRNRGITEEKVPQIVEMLVPDLMVDQAAIDSAASVAVEALPENLTAFSTGDEILPPGGLYTTEISRYWDAMVVSPSGRQGLVEHKAAKTGLAGILLFLGALFLSRARKPLGPWSYSRVFLLFLSWGLTLVLTILFAKSGVTELSSFTFTMFGAALTAVFFDQRSRELSVPFSWILAMLFSAMFALHSPHPMTTFFISMIPACLVAYLIADLSDRAIFQALSAGIVSSLVVYWLLSTSGSSGSRSFTPVIWLSILGLPLVVTGMVRVLVHPLELLFNMATPLAYQRLQSDGHPLRVEMSSRAPGTYAHSSLVADMAGRAAEAIGADASLARLGGIYHDIGKLSAPGMFVENIKNAERNSPHLELPPLESARIIISHVENGVRLAEKHRLPRDIVDIIEQHHGDSPVRFFLEKARREQPPGTTLDETLFHYPFPVPKSREAALVMLADTISSAIIGLGSDASSDRKTLTVTGILRETEDSGLFDECCFPPSERRKAVNVFLEVMDKKNYERVKNFPHGK